MRFGAIKFQVWRGLPKLLKLQEIAIEILNIQLNSTWEATTVIVLANAVVANPV